MTTIRHLANRVLRLSGNLFAWGMLAYSLGLLVLTILWASGPSKTWWLALTNIFAFYLFVPLPVLILLALRSRSVPLHSATWLMLILFLGQFGMWLLPPHAAPSEGRALRLLTFNHYYYNSQPEAVTAAIRAQRADIVTLEELSYTVADHVSEDLADIYPYRYLQPGLGWAGQGVLSRFPIIEQERLYDIGLQRLVLDIDGTHVTLLNAHLPSPKYSYTWRADRRIPVLDDYNPSLREWTLPLLLKAIDTTTGPLIAMGDFNTAEREESYNQIAQRMTDSYRSTNWGLGATYPKAKEADLRQILPALVRIDYIWVRDRITPSSSWVNCASVGSDHCMVGAEVYLNTTAANSAP
ncbi:MAG: endonuclease/exonuclease/phosphatase family protein, partial [Roseiflexaceae bacterium]|nr:endonuclease/exonuclease/phosphatase family protein [Roseiflexaceae bacterium]